MHHSLNMIPFSPPHIDQAIINEVVNTLQSGWITTGPRTKLLEQKLNDYNQSKATLCLNSATAGLEIILRWFGVQPGDEVILPAYTYGATANVVVHCGATPVFVDICADFTICPIEIFKAITPSTKVIMPVDFAGYPCNYAEINTLVQCPEIRSLFSPQTDVQQQLGRILVLSDAAHSLGAMYYQQKTGSLTDVTVFSFHAVKNLTTAEGGAIGFNLPPPFDNKAIYDHLCIKTLHGQNKDALAKTKPGNWEYDIIEAGYKMNMPDLLAAIGLVELERYEASVLPKRKHIFETYSRLLAPYDWILLPEYKNTFKQSSYHVYALRIKNCTRQQRDEIITMMFDKGVSVNVHFKPLPMMSFYKKMGYDINHYPKSLEYFSQEISLPVHLQLSEENLLTVIQTLVSAVQKILNY
jgi:dTDP-4-amino-4,6-dideoxygalactose transaminase